MKNTLSLIGAVLCCLSASSQTWIKPADALDFRGKQVSVVGRVTEIKHKSYNNIGAVLLTMHGDPMPLAFFIAGKHRKRFPISGEDLVNEYVQVNGRVVMRKGKPCIRLKSKSQFAVLHQAPEIMRFEPL